MARPANRRTEPAITFSVISRNEEATLERALGEALAAAGPADRVWLVDGMSEDGSRSVADRLGVEVVPAPVGKGRAIDRALSLAQTPYLCLLDGDIHDTTENIAAAIASAVRDRQPDMAIGEFTDFESGVASVTAGIYQPIVSQLFPDISAMFGRKPLSGFRALRTDMALGRLPPGFGVEAHLNIVTGLSRGAQVETVNVGGYRGRFQYKSRIGDEVASAVLDLAQEAGLLSPRARRAWDAWATRVVDHIATYTGKVDGRRKYIDELVALSRRVPQSTLAAAPAAQTLRGGRRGRDLAGR